MMLISLATRNVRFGILGTKSQKFGTFESHLVLCSVLWTKWVKSWVLCQKKCIFALFDVILDLISAKRICLVLFEADLVLSEEKFGTLKKQKVTSLEPTDKITKFVINS